MRSAAMHRCLHARTGSKPPGESSIRSSATRRPLSNTSRIRGDHPKRIVSLPVMAAGTTLQRITFMTTPDEVVYLLDVDNTFLDNDRVQADLKSYLEREFGPESSNRYWSIFDQLRAELGYADYLGALQRYRLGDMHDPRLLMVSSFLVDYPFANRLYPGSLDAIEHLRKWGLTVILSDGDVVFQPRKVQRSGLWEAVEGRVLIYIHKEQMLGDVKERYPAQHYVMVDDKLHILAAMKKALGERLTTIFPRQGHYALDPKIITTNPPADLTIERIGELVNYDLNALLKERIEK